MTQHRILAAVAAAVVAQAAPAAAVAFVQADLNHDGVVEFDEASRAYPELKAVLFRKCDGNRDGVIEKLEYACLESMYNTLYRLN